MTAAVPATADLVDEYGDDVQSCDLQFRRFGGRRRFQGTAVTVRVHDDNILVKEAVAQDGTGRVLVVDGDGSVHGALLGDNMAATAAANGWEGIVVHGAVRDVVALRGIDIGIAAVGTNPRRSGKARMGHRDVPLVLGGAANLVGKSVAADSDRCRLATLESTPLTEWTPPDACFVVCQSALISSGTPSRNEEFSGTQLVPDRLEAFLRGRVEAYGGDVTAEIEQLAGPDRLFALAQQAQALRQHVVDNGASMYRTVQSMTINKTEHMFTSAVTGADLPDAFVQTVMKLVPGTSEEAVRSHAVSWRSAVGVHQPSETFGFGSRFEEVLHALVAATAKSTSTDVSMSRGPRNVLALDRLLAEESIDPGHWKTNKYYCCVTPSEAFRRKFEEVPDELPQVVRAIAARMRWNCWHFMPHTAGVSDDPSFTDRDWFYAPAMPDMTEWTSHHHHGHVANGVRHAIRVPLSLSLGGSSRPGVHDLRLMRASDPPYDLSDLRAAVAMGQCLRSLYQARADQLISSGVEKVVDDFDNGWYQNHYTLAGSMINSMATVDSGA